MVRTKQSQIVNARLCTSGIVYMRASNQQRNSSKGIVQLDIELAIIQDVITEENVNIVDENNLPKVDGAGNLMHEVVTVKTPKLRVFEVHKAYFKEKVFDTVLKNPTPADYDKMLMEQIVFLNSKEWTGKEIQQTRFWNLGAKDMESISDEKVLELLKPVIIR